MKTVLRVATAKFTNVETGEVGYTYADPLDVLRQDKVWKDRQGRVIPLSDISKDYAANIQRFLRRRALQLHQIEIETWSLRLNGPLGPRGDMATYHAEGEFFAVCSAKPVDWLNGTELMLALEAIVSK